MPERSALGFEKSKNDDQDKESEFLLERLNQFKQPFAFSLLFSYSTFIDYFYFSLSTILAIVLSVVHLLFINCIGKIVDAI